MSIRTRFAPSPTGKLHIGGVRTALYCYALANKHKGQFILRIEDTDQSRFVEGAIEMMIDMLKIYNIEPNESTVHGGDKGPYIQSERLEIYQKYANQLVEQGDAYYCFLTKEELDERRKSAEEQGEKFICRSPYRDLDLDEAKKRAETGEGYVIRQKIPNNKIIKFDDPLQGKMEFNSDDVDDTVLLKSDGFPTYHLAVVIDDHLMEMTHVFRGVEWISSSPKHVLLYESLGWDMPILSHLPVILDPKGGKLSKRDGSVSADEFLSEGYLPEAILNFLMLLGWSSPEERVHGEKEREFYTLAEFVELFDPKDLNKSNPIFNREKLLWFNQKYIQNFTPDELVVKFTKWLDSYSTDHKIKKEIVDKGPDYLEQVLELVKERAKLFSEIPEMLEPFYYPIEKTKLEEVIANTKQTKKLNMEQVESVLKMFKDELETKKSVKEWGHDGWEQFVRGMIGKLELKPGEVFMTLRIGILGTPFSPPLFESMEILEKEEVLNRL